MPTEKQHEMLRLLPTSHMSLAELRVTRNKLIAAAARLQKYNGMLMDPKQPEVQGLLRAYATAIIKREAERAKKQPTASPK